MSVDAEKFAQSVVSSSDSKLDLQEKLNMYIEAKKLAEEFNQRDENNSSTFMPY
jgi:hypothetical protein